MRKTKIKIFETSNHLINELSDELVRYFKTLNKSQKHITVALSGGNTPKEMFKYLAENYSEDKIWDSVIFFWGDERCVPPDSSESNFGEAERLFFSRLKNSKLHIFRVQGEDNPEQEAERYSELINKNVDKENGLPKFDLVLLGIGEDGHTASIFPDQISLFDSDKICAVAVQPKTGQKRITLTGKVINNSTNIIVMAAGKSKSKILKEIILSKNKKYPAARIKPASGNLLWFTDESAASELFPE